MGAVLAASFDRAVTLLFKNWRLVLLLWCVSLVGSIFSAVFVSIVNLVWFFFAAAIAVRTILPEFAMSSRSAGAFFWTSIVAHVPSVLLVVLVVFLVPGAAALWQGSPGPSTILGGAALAACGLVGLALEAKIGFAPLLTQLEGIATTPALQRSWGLTRGKFWPTLFFVAVVLLGITALRWLPTLGIAALLLRMPYPAGFAVPAPIIASVSASLASPFGAYAELAGFVAYVFYLRFLGAPLQYSESAIPA